ncbi:hypothetical protein BHM03_00063060 [Ensete ventricosum]|nr:hypothetical protein BHM03_00063060 [Ensete ventricosum]
MSMNQKEGDRSVVNRSEDLMMIDFGGDESLAKKERPIMLEPQVRQKEVVVLSIMAKGKERLVVLAEAQVDSFLLAAAATQLILARKVCSIWRRQPRRSDPVAESIGPTCAETTQPVGWKEVVWGLAIGRGTTAIGKQQDTTTASSLLRRRAEHRETMGKQRRFIVAGDMAALSAFDNEEYVSLHVPTSTDARLGRMAAWVVRPQRATTDRGENRHR